LRGVISARTGLSARRSTRSIMCRSSRSSAPASTPSATTALTSSPSRTVAGPGGAEQPQHEAEDCDITQIAGDVIRASQASGRDTTTAMRSGSRSATCFGTSSPG
jgi:hypothetical protein